MKTAKKKKQNKTKTKRPQHRFNLKIYLNFFSPFALEKFEDIKEVIRNHKSKKDRQHNGQKKKYKQ